MEAPFVAKSWDGVTGPIFAGYGSTEMPWLVATYLCVLIAVILGWRHERHAYKAASTHPM
ncbi:hypothetical protein [Thioclava sp. FTW29]|uniref:Heme exporter protein D n=1 Tax=Thioclava litoralis TaxID=3076557 RepID=A0ABZ1E6F0_9RHOB|nr:hypothetical protein RPE78_17045 [Thioclava sp. FTW29]